MFPQIAGLGCSDLSRRYAICSLAKAVAYLKHSVLGKRLVEISEAVLAVKSKTAQQIFGSPDDVKLKSSMTLFLIASEGKNSVFKQVLDKYSNGEKDTATMRELNQPSSSELLNTLNFDTDA